MSVHPIEALLRPPVEAWSASTAAIGAAICLLAPWALFMTPGVAYGAALLFGWLAGRADPVVLASRRKAPGIPAEIAFV